MRLFIVGIVAVALAACGGPPPPKAGTVIGRSFDPAHDEWFPPIMVPGHEECFPAGKTEDCSYFPGVFVPGHSEHYNDTWSVNLRDGKRHGWRIVPHTAYDLCQVGAGYPACANPAPATTTSSTEVTYGGD